MVCKTNAPRRPRRSGYFDLRAPVGWDQENMREDVIKLESLLGETRDHDVRRTDGPTGWFGLALDKGIRRFRKRSGARVDGRVNPGGETLRRLHGLLGPKLEQKEPLTPDQIDDHHTRLARGENSPYIRSRRCRG